MGCEEVGTADPRALRESGLAAPPCPSQVIMWGWVSVHYPSPWLLRWMDFQPHLRQSVLPTLKMLTEWASKIVPKTAVFPYRDANNLVKKREAIFLLQGSPKSHIKGEVHTVYPEKSWGRKSCPPPPSLPSRVCGHELPRWVHKGIEKDHVPDLHYCKDGWRVQSHRGQSPLLRSSASLRLLNSHSCRN